MLFTLALVIGVVWVLRNNIGGCVLLLVGRIDDVWLTNYVQEWEIYCATFCWCGCGRRIAKMLIAQ